MIPKYIVIHHSLTEDGKAVSWGDIRRYHEAKLGWRGLGYHWGIELVGDFYEVLLGRWWDEPGAHAKEAGMNSRSLGVCLVGDFDALPPPTQQWDRAVALVRRLQQRFGIARDDVIGHREVGLMVQLDWREGRYKTCPGRAFDLGQFRAELIQM